MRQPSGQRMPCWVSQEKDRKENWLVSTLFTLHWTISHGFPSYCYYCYTFNSNSKKLLSYSGKNDCWFLPKNFSPLVQNSRESFANKCRSQLSGRRPIVLSTVPDATIWNSFTWSTPHSCPYLLLVCLQTYSYTIHRFCDPFSPRSYPFKLKVIFPFFNFGRHCCTWCGTVMQVSLYPISLLCYCLVCQH